MLCCEISSWGSAGILQGLLVAVKREVHVVMEDGTCRVLQGSWPPSSGRYIL